MLCKRASRARWLNASCAAHFKSKSITSEAARTVRGRIGQGVANVSLKSLADQLMNAGSSSLPPPSKRDGIDDGPPLP